MALTLHGTVSDNTVALDRKTATPLIINGDMAIAQRGTSAVTTQFSFPVDRWTIYNSGGTFTAQQQTFTLGDAPDSRLQNYVRITRSSPSGILFFSQKIEDVINSNDVTLTVSFYAKANTNITLPVRLSQEFGSGGSTAVTVGSVNSSVTSSWQRFTATFVCPSLSGKTIGTGSYLELTFDTPATYSTLDITAVQLEVGTFDANSIPPFQFEDRATSLARCQRYFWRLDTPSVGTRYSVGMNNVATDSSQLFYCPTMRSAPTVNFSDITISEGGTHRNATGTNGIRQGNGYLNITFTVASGLTVGGVSMTRASTTSGNIEFDSEL